MNLYEDIFNSTTDATELILRLSENTRVNFDEAKFQYSFDHIKNLIANKDLPCYFSKQTETEHKITIPLYDVGGQLEIIAVWNYGYEIKVNKHKKTKYNPNSELLEKQYLIEQTCVIRFIDLGEQYENYEVLGEISKLKKRVDNLEIAPKTLFENQREIWTKYIEAQELLIKHLQEPFSCTGKYNLTKQKNNKDEVSRYKFKVDLVADKNDEYRIFEEELKTLDIEETFDSEGTVFLAMDEIFRGLDSIITKKFSEIVEREQKIGCILEIRPFSMAQRIQSLLPQATVTKDKEHRELWINNLTDCLKSVNPVLSEFGLEWTDVAVDFKITNIENLYHTPLNEKYSLTFGRKFQKKITETEILLPEPITDNIIRIVKPVSENLIEDVLLFYHSLCRIYGKENIELSQSYIFESDFSTDYWRDIKRELYLLEFDVTVSELDQTLYFDFSDRDDLTVKYETLKQLHKFDITKSPLDDDFRFKVKTNLIAKKTAKQIFQEKIEKLRSVEFVFDKEDKRRETIFIG